MQIIQQPFADLYASVTFWCRKTGLRESGFVVQNKKVANQNEGGKEWQKIVNPFLPSKRRAKKVLAPTLINIVVRC